MANELDETRDTINPEGRDVGVIEKQLPIKVGVGSKRTYFLNYEN